MPSKVYYNEIDPYAAAWLHNLMVEGVIAPGDVDTRSIEDVTPNDLAGYDQCHFFAGIGVWSYALRLAGWPDDRPVWTGSCPCQPFSAAGKGGGFADERHLWPAFYHLIGERRPPVVFGEQVASKDGLGWLDLVQADLEGADYTSAAVDTCAAGFGAPHIRQRLYWVADCSRVGRREERADVGRIATGNSSQGWPAGFESSSMPGRVADRDGQRLSGRREPDVGSQQSKQPAPRRADTGGRGEDVELADSSISSLGAFNGQSRQSVRRQEPVGGHGVSGELGDNNNPGLAVGSLSDDGGRVVRVERSAFGEAEPVRGFWSGADWIACRDGKWRPVESGTFPLASGITNRVGRLRAYGNAIVAWQAKEFIAAYLEC